MLAILSLTFMFGSAAAASLPNVQHFPTSCSASSEHPGSYECEHAYDGVVASGASNEWATHGQQEGAKISLNMGKFVTITRVALANRESINERNKDVEIRDDAGKTTTVTMQNNADLNSVTLPVAVSGFEFDLTVLNTYSRTSDWNNGLREAQVFGYEIPANVGVASCSASSAHPGGYECQHAYDGVIAGGSGNEWATYVQGVDAWIELNLDGNYELYGIAMNNRASESEANRGVRMSFSDGSTQDVEMRQTPDGLHENVMQGFRLTPVVTNKVRLTITSVWSSYNNGFQEIKLWGRKIESGEQTNGLWCGSPRFPHNGCEGYDSVSLGVIDQTTTSPEQCAKICAATASCTTFFTDLNGDTCNLASGTVGASGNSGCGPDGNTLNFYSMGDCRPKRCPVKYVDSGCGTWGTYALGSGTPTYAGSAEECGRQCVEYAGCTTFFYKNNQCLIASGVPGGPGGCTTDGNTAWDMYAVDECLYADTLAPTASPTTVPTDAPTNAPTVVPTAAPTVDPTASPTQYSTTVDLSVRLSVPSRRRALLALEDDFQAALADALGVDAKDIVINSVDLVVNTDDEYDVAFTLTVYGDTAEEASNAASSAQITVEDDSFTVAGYPTVEITDAPTISPTGSPTSEGFKAAQLADEALEVHPWTTGVIGDVVYKCHDFRGCYENTAALRKTFVVATTEVDKSQLNPETQHNTTDGSFIFSADGIVFVSTDGMTEYHFPHDCQCSGATPLASTVDEALKDFFPTDAPTGTPTSDPTGAPTSTPSAAPTSTPSAAPTSDPTSSPTAGPTSLPTAAPTHFSENLVGKVIALSNAQFPGKYCSDVSTGVVCTTPHIQAWEMWNVVDAGSGKIALVGGKHGTYCSDVQLQGKQTICTTPALAAWEMFTLERISDSQFGLVGGAGGQYCGTRGSDGFMVCNRAALGSQETWSFTVVE